MRRRANERRTRAAATRGHDRAFSTGEAARYCYVSADTIVNWVRGGALQAQRTVGGQYRVLARELRRFLCDHGMSTELLDAELDVRLPCWEFHGGGDLDPRCASCLAYRSGALNCFELSPMTPADERLLPDCARCAYHRRYGTEAPHAP